MSSLSVETDDLSDDLPEHKRRAIERVRKVSKLLDEAFRVPGTDFRFGLDPLLGLLPVGGDAASAAISLYIVLEGYLMDVPNRKLARMVVNILLDTTLGAIPVLGTLLDAVLKANTWNKNILENHVSEH
jgi:hypothetical protein